MSVAPRGLQHWLLAREASWHRLSEWVESGRDRGASHSAEVIAIARAHAGLATDVGLARSVLGANADLTRRLEALLAASTARLYRAPSRWRDQVVQLFTTTIVLRMRALRGRLAAVVAIFLLAGLAGGLLVDKYPELAGLIASENMIRSVQGGYLWTDGLLSVVPPAFLAFSIMSNNIVVALFAFTLGSFYGIGTLYILLMNGFMLGGVFAFTARYGLADELLRFVLAHGVVELAVICIAAAAGISLGEALARPGPRSRARAFQRAVMEAGQVLMVCVLFLVGAGIIEGYVSPDDMYPLAARVVIGCAYGFLLFVVMSGVWVRDPHKRRSARTLS